MRAKLRAFWLRLRRWLSPPRRIRPSRAGWFVASMPVVMGVAAVSASNNLLFLLVGASLGTIALSGVLSEQNLRDIDVELSTVGAAYCGEPGRMLVSARRRGQRPRDAAAVEVALKAPNADSVSAIFPLVGGAPVTLSVPWVFGRRGAFSAFECEVATRYPFGLLRKARDLAARSRIVVRPRRVDVPDDVLSAVGLFDAVRGGLSAAVGGELFGIREHREGDALTKIHARRSLAMGRPVVLELRQNESALQHVVLVSDRGTDAVSFERALEVLQALLLAWHAKERPFVVSYPGGTVRSDSASIERVLDAIACADSKDELPDPVAHMDSAVWLLPEQTRGPGKQRGPRLHVDREGQVRVAEAA